jgi:hypothetical protein
MPTSTGTALRTMNIAISGRQADGSSPTRKQKKSGPMQALRFLSKLLTYTIAAFALATLTLFSLNAGQDYLMPDPQHARPAQQHAELPGFVEKLANACWQGSKATLLAAPAAQCMAIARKAMQHLLGASISARMVNQIAGKVSILLTRQIRSRVYRLPLH